MVEAQSAASRFFFALNKTERESHSHIRGWLMKGGHEKSRHRKAIDAAMAAQSLPSAIRGGEKEGG